MVDKSRKVFHEAKVSRNGQISIPAHIRARWNNPEEVVIIDMHNVDGTDQILVFAKLSLEEGLARSRGVDKGKWPPTDELRRQMREEEMMIEDRDRREGVMDW